MSSIKLAVLLICCIHIGHAAELEAPKQPSPDAQIESIVATKLTPSVEEQKSKTEKRDSSDQTANVYTSKTAKESSFRSIYPSASYYEATDSGAIFGPTTLRYTAADAAAPQSYYEKPENGNSIRYVPQPTAAGHKHATALRGLPGPIQFATQQHQQQQEQQQHQQQPQQQQPHRFRFAVPPQVELYQRPVAKPMPIYSYAETEPSLYERAGPQQYQLSAAPPMTLQQSPRLQRFQYIIAIPLSYMRQLQQQLATGLVPQQPPSTEATSTSSTAATTAAAAPPPSAPAMQLLGPLARDHQGMYRPYYQSDSASAPSALPTAMAAYGQHYLQIPANVLLAAAQQLQQQQALYPKSTATPPSSIAHYQPLVYQSQPPQQLQLQRIYHTPTIYAEQPPVAPPQTSALYAYPLHQQHQQQPARLFRLGPKQQQQQQQQHQYVAAPSAATPSASAPTTTASTTTLMLPPPPTAAGAGAAAAHEQQQHQALPVVHYNPIYVQSPAEHQLQQQQQQHQFAILPRFSNNNPKAAYNLAHESTPPIQVVRLSAANALGHQHLHHHQHHQPQTTTIQHFQQQQQQQQPYQQALHQQQQQFYHTHPGTLSNYVEEPQQQHSQHSHSPVSPAIIPYFSHPGAVHYGTHLYHPAAGVATHSTTSTKQQQHQRLAAATAATSGRLPGDNGMGGAGVKQPIASANIVKYP